MGGRAEGTVGCDVFCCVVMIIIMLIFKVNVLEKH